MAIDGENRLLGIRSVVETPVLDERKWSKTADYPKDAVLVHTEHPVVLAQAGIETPWGCAHRADRRGPRGRGRGDRRAT